MEIPPSITTIIEPFVGNGAEITLSPVSVTPNWCVKCIIVVQNKIQFEGYNVSFLKPSIFYAQEVIY